MILRSSARFARFLVLIVLIIELPGSTRSSAQSAPLPSTVYLPQAITADGIIQQPTRRTVPPIVPPNLPNLALEVAVLPDPLTVGATATISVTILNQAPTPAHDLVVTLPLPTGAVALPGLATRATNQGWRWRVGHLDGGSSTTLTATLRLERMPDGGALLLSPQATAHSVPEPVVVTGGALVEAPAGAPLMLLNPGATDGDPSATGPRIGRVAVHGPAGVLPAGPTLRTLEGSSAGAQTAALARPLPNGKRGLGIFVLESSDAKSVPVTIFTQPLTLTVRYTPEQLLARGISEADLTLFTFDIQRQAWLPLPTRVDPTTRTASAQISAAAPYQLSDGSSPSAAYIPGLQGFQSSLFTGAAAYSIPIEVPATAGGLKPHLVLAYSSATSDGVSGMRSLWQASWVGKGWSLSAEGYVGRSRSLVGSAWDHFTLVFGGRSFDVVRGQLTGTPGCTDYYNHADWHCWTWHPVDENFVRVRAVQVTGGHVWNAWTKDGTRYEFTQPLREYREIDSQSPEVYKWLLTRVVDPHGNPMVYTYRVDNAPNDAAVQPTYHLQSILWGYDGATPGTGVPRYQVLFETGTRAAGFDTQWEYPAAPNERWRQSTPHEAYQLTTIKVLSMPPGSSTYELVQHYKLRYATSAECPVDPTQRVPGHCTQTDVSDGQRTLTLLGVQRAGKDGSTTLPEITFTYGTSQGNQNNPTPGWNRLLTVANGQGGRLTFDYDHTFQLSAVPANDWHLYKNYYRVKQVLRQDITGQSYSTSALTTYTYGPAALNDEAHAATVVYAHYPTSGNGNSLQFLARQEKREFRGHASVVEKTYDGPTASAPLLQEVAHWFYQGDAGCTPQIIDGRVVDTDNNPNTDNCFEKMVKHEGWKGMEYRTEVRNGGASQPLQRTVRTFNRIDLPFFGNDGDPAHAQASNHYRRAGLWRAFSYEHQTVREQLEGGTTPSSHKTVVFYNPSCQMDSAATLGYGNVSCIQEYDQAGALVRTTKRWFAARNDLGSYLVDRVWQEAIVDNQGRLLALTNSFYDGANAGTVGTRGLLTRVSKYYDVPLQADATGITLHSSDTTYAYDVYGNLTQEATYAGAGARLYQNGTLTFSAPGGGTAARITAISYDDPATGVNEAYSGLSRQVTNPVGHVQRADYDYRMGTLIRQTGPNVSGTPTDCRLASYSIPATEETTCAQYDVFGRLIKLIKPGDSTPYPTLEAVYLDGVQPFRYRLYRREVPGQTWAVAIEQQFYDGLGRKIQTKHESINGTQQIVMDMRYDGLNRLVQQSQPRYVNEDSSTPAFWNYTPPGASLYNPTMTSYDALARPVQITAPDGTTTRHFYGIVNNMPYDDVVDPNRHRVQRRWDSLGRLREVIEIAGNCGDYWAAFGYGCGGAFTAGWTVYATTRYTYSPLDLLTQVDDTGATADGLGAHNTTRMAYDSLGRKLTMSDPDMGMWYYGHDANGQLVSQRDARGLPITFTYDDLGRLTSKFTNDASVTSFSDAFDTKNTSNWTWSAQQTVPYNDNGANVVKSTGTGSSWDANFARAQYSISSGKGIFLRFKVDATNPSAIFALETGNGTSYRRFGVVAENGKMYVQYTLDGSTYPVPPASDLIPTLQTNIWYVLQLVADDASGFTAQVYQENNPAVRGSYTFKMTAGQSWRFHHWIYRNTAYIDSYNERAGMVYGYDEGTNGKGQRTSMQALNISKTTWSYDARGRKRQATHDVAGVSRTFQWAYDSADRLMALTYPAVGGITEQLTYAYDAAWRLQSVCTNRANQPCYVTNNVQYSPLDQPVQWKFGNNLYQTWSYSNPLQRLTRLQVGTASAIGGLFDRSYSYDNVGNVTSIVDNTGAPIPAQSFGYDDRDRLTSWGSGGVMQLYSYDRIGNLTNKVGVSYSYPAAGSARPHAPTSVGGQAYQYDANGNLVSGGGRTYTWNADNLPTRISQAGVTEDYRYDADGERVKMVKGSTTTIYLEGLWEEVVGGATKVYYSFAGRIVAVRDTGTNAVSYLHGDHLGSVSLATNTAGALASQQEFDPWGKVRSGGVAQTGLNYTGQQLDGTGLLYYHARMYDPNLGRFISADSIVPGAASGSGGGVATLGLDSSSQLAPMTVDFHETGFVAVLNGENAFRQAKGFWFQLSGEDQQQAKSPFGPANPQALNRYAYTLNNPLRYVDPTGHLRREAYSDQCKCFYGYQTVIDSSTGRPVIKNDGTPLYYAYTCNIWHTDCHIVSVWGNDPSFVAFRQAVDDLDAKFWDAVAGIALATGAGLGAVLTCIGTGGIGCAAVLIGAVAAGGNATIQIYKYQQAEWRAKDSFLYLWGVAAPRKDGPLMFRWRHIPLPKQHTPW